MGNTKRFKALLLAAMMLLSVTLFAACGESQSAEADYKVTVMDAAGNPVSTGYAVRFMQNGQQVAMQIPNEKGESVKNMTRGDYTVELQFTGDQKYHYVQDMTLTKDKTELTVKLAYTLSDESVELFVGDGDATVYFVNAGCTYIQLDSQKRSFFIFKPDQEGTYEFTVLENDAAIGYYGAPHFVQSISAAEVVDNKFTLSIREDTLAGSGYVIGVDAGEGSAILSITRTGDPQWSVEYEPWTVYQPTAQIEKFTLAEDIAVTDFDLSLPASAYPIVYNESDGYYHLGTADGPCVLTRLGSQSKTRYTDPLGKMIEVSAVTSYFFDENGDFLKKESYTECLQNYCDGEDNGLDGTIDTYFYLDPVTHTYPLTEDLKYIIQQRGAYAQWWDASSVHYLFKDANGAPLSGINPETAWLFMCGCPADAYEMKAAAKPYTLPAGAKISEFDLTADAYQLVLGSDGTYRLNSADGPQVLVRLADESQFDLPYCLTLESQAAAETLYKHHFDGNGVFTKAEYYNDCVAAYADCADSQKGLYPLTEDLMYIIQQLGEQNGWWNPESGNYMFKDANGVQTEGINSEIAWLFMCCYIG